MYPFRTLHRQIHSFSRLQNPFFSSQKPHCLKSISLSYSTSHSWQSDRGPRRLKSNSRFEDKSENPLRMRESPLDHKKLSLEMEIFVRHLYSKGYFNYVHLLPNNQLVLNYFEYRYGRDFIKSAAEKFGRDNQEIAKWLSGSDLKKIALFGCPSIARKNVFAAKRLRKFFGIQEDTVCHKCIFKQSCKYVNQSVWNCGTKNLNLAVVMVVITQYALEAVPLELVIPEDIKASASRLLKEILKLSPTVSRN